MANKKYLLFLSGTMLCISTASAMQSGLLPGIKSSNKQVAQSKKIELPSQTLLNSIQFKYAVGSNGRWVALTKDNQNNIGLILIRPHDKNQQILLCTSENIKCKLNDQDAVILLQKPTIFNQGKYALIWQNTNGRIAPILFDLTHQELIPIECQIEQPNQNVFTQNITATLEHPLTLGTTLDPQRNNHFFVLNADKKQLSHVPPIQNLTWQQIDSMAVTGDGNYGIALTRTFPFNDPDYLQIDLKNPQILKIIPTTGAPIYPIKSFTVNNQGRLITELQGENQGKIGILPIDLHSQNQNIVKWNALSYTIKHPQKDENIFMPVQAPVSFPCERYIFVALPFGKQIRFGLYDPLLQEQGASPWTFKEFKTFNNINQNTIIYFSEPERTSDRNYFISVQLFDITPETQNLNDEELIALIKQQPPTAILYVDIIGASLVCITPNEFFLSKNLTLQDHYDHTIIFQDPNQDQPELYFAQIPTIRRTGPIAPQFEKWYVQNIPDQNHNEFKEKILAIKGATTTGNVIRQFKEKELKYCFMSNGVNHNMLSAQKNKSNPIEVDGTYTLQSVSKNLTWGAGCLLPLTGAQLPKPIGMHINKGTPCSLSNNYGIARYILDKGTIAAGCFLNIPKIQETKRTFINPTIWTYNNDTEKYDEQILLDKEGEFTCLNETGTYAAGKYAINNQDHAALYHLPTKKWTDLGPGKIFEMTWDAKHLCGIYFDLNNQPRACMWSRKNDNTWAPFIIPDSKQIDVANIVMDRQNGHYVIFKKEEKFYFWSKQHGTILLTDFFKEQNIYFLTKENSIETILPEIQSIEWANGKDIVFTGKDNNPYTVLIPDTHALAESIE